MVTSARAERALLRTGSASRQATAEQLLTVGVQFVSGVANLAFSLIMARLLVPDDFTAFRAFLALNLLITMPAGSLSAGTAVVPETERSSSRVFVRFAIPAAVAIVILAAPLGVLLRIPVPLVILTAVFIPIVGPTALARGRLWGTGKHVRSAASILVTFVARLAVGVPLGLAFGVGGAAAGVVIGGYLGLVVASDRTSTSRRAAVAGAVKDPTATWTTGAFFLLALMGNQDLLLANRLLPAMDAALFAGVSTVGGIAMFATVWVPTVMLPRTARGDESAYRVALRLSVLLGAAVLAVTLAAPSEMATLILGPRYGSTASLLAPYMLAMALFGVNRVLAAHRCATGRTRSTVVLVGLVVLGHALGVALLAEAANQVVMATLAANVGLMVVFLSARVIDLRVRSAPAPGTMARLRSRMHLDRTVVIVIGLVAVGAALRLLVLRGLWVDEAITVSQAKMSFGGMLDNLRMHDVHPPLHYAVMWAVVHLFGAGELAVRLPSIVAGVLLVPVLYGLGNELFGRKTAMLAAIFATVCPFLLWYSQEARMYSLVMLFGACAIWAQVRAIRSGSIAAWAAYGVAATALLWTHYFGVLQVAVQQVVFLGAILRARDGSRKRIIVGWLSTSILMAVAVAPLIPLATNQLEALDARRAARIPAQVGSDVSDLRSGLSIYTVIANASWAFFGYHSDRTMAQIAALWPLLMVLLFVLLGRAKPKATTAAVAAIAILPIGLLFLAGFEIRNWFEVRYFAVAVPLLLLLGARIITKCASRPRVFLATSTAAVLLLVGAGVDQQINGTNPRIYDFRGALQNVSALSSRDDTMLYSPDFLKPVVDYYAPGVKARFATGKIPKIHGGQRIYVLGSFFDDRAISGRTGTLLSKLEDRYRLVQELRYPRVRVWVFAAKSNSNDHDKGDRDKHRRRAADRSETRR